MTSCRLLEAMLMFSSISENISSMSESLHRYQLQDLQLHQLPVVVATSCHRTSVAPACHQLWSNHFISSILTSVQYTFYILLTCLPYTYDIIYQCYLLQFIIHDLMLCLLCFVFYYFHCTY
jgi:hypothetical protein